MLAKSVHEQRWYSFLLFSSLPFYCSLKKSLKIFELARIRKLEYLRNFRKKCLTQKGSRDILGITKVYTVRYSHFKNHSDTIV